MAVRRRIEYSVFGPDFVSAFVQQKWGWKRVRCEFWHRGTSDTYRVERKGSRAYLKIYPHDWRSKSEILGEVELLNFLSAANISVSIPIKSNAGGFVNQINAPEGRRYALLFSEAQGTQPRFSLKNCKAYGRLAGTIHNATDLLPSTVQRPQLGIDNLAREPLERIRAFLIRRPRDLDYLTRVSEDLANAVVSLLPTSIPEFGICHGDLTFGNLRRNNSSRFTVFDFDYSAHGWRAYDVAVFLWSRGSDFSPDANASRTKQWNAFLDGYQAVRPLSDSELQAVELFVPLRQIWQLGVHTNHLVHIGSRAMHEMRFESHLEFIKNWMRVRKPL